VTDITSPPDVAGITSTTGTGPWTITGTLATPAGGTYRPWSSVPTGSRVHCIRQDDGGVNFERGYADVVVTGGIAVMSWYSRAETSAGGASPVSWAGAQNVLVLPGSVHAPNGGSEFAPYAAAFRASIGVQSAGQYASATLGLIPAGAGTDGAWTGGTVGKAVRWASANTMANAGNTDTDAQLSLLAYLSALGYHVGTGLITGLSSLTAGAVYFLGTSGNMLSWTSGALPVTVTAGGSVKLVRLGFAPSTTSLLWSPQLIARG